MTGHTEEHKEEMREENGEFSEETRKKAILVGARFASVQTEADASAFRTGMAELKGLADACGYETADVITQNIDGLHQAAGSKTVLELHGSVLRNYCEKCHQFYGLNAILNSTGIPHCEKCGGTIKPDVVLYEEGLDEKTINAAVRYIHEADVLIIGGTSLAVYPAAGLIDYFQGDKLVVINKSATPRDSHADLLVQGPIGEVFHSIQNP